MRSNVNEKDLATEICPLTLCSGGVHVCVFVCVCICAPNTLRSLAVIVMLLHIYFWSTELNFSIATEK